MGGGITQLVLKGQMDSYINLNPCINYYKYVYNKHVNFSMENKNVIPDINSSINLAFTTENKMITFTIKRYGDLVSNMYLSFNLPDIYSTDVHRFRWITNVGHNFIKTATIRVEGSVIDEIYGEWMNIWNELTNKDGVEYNKLIGNIPEYTNPNNNNTRYVIRNNILYNKTYPTTDKVANAGNPSIKGRILQVPLNFWFTRNPSLALPLYKIQNQEIKVDVNINDIELLYQVWCDKLKLYVSPKFYNMIYKDTIKINTFIGNESYIQCFLDVNYIFLDSAYRMSSLQNEGIVKYVVDYVKRQAYPALNITSYGDNYTLTNSYNHIKEIVWVLRRTDVPEKFNIHDNYTASHTYNETMGLLETAQIKWADTIIREDQKAYYYNNIQPYQYHTNVPRTGIYSYSFSLFPEKIVSAGSFNNQMITTSLYININNRGNNDGTKDITKKNEFKYLFDLMRRKEVPYINENEVKLDVIVYTRVINVFSVINGTCNFMWSR
uniref:Major capsid protein N-terminal domain-containing protein n=1 Tax=viral metagenome TaxID=1070528 RepID=A0A6C0LLG0_9ZZZZ